jgi:hypothetical protein
MKFLSLGVLSLALTWQQGVPAAAVLNSTLGEELRPEQCDKISRSNVCVVYEAPIE